jgi:SAM-dependent methyltransferase
VFLALPNLGALRRLLRRLNAGAVLYSTPWIRRLYVDARYDREYRSDPIWETGKPPKELVDLVEGGSIKPGSAMDLGAGRGHTVRYLQSKGFDAWGLDISSLACQQAAEISIERGFRANFIHADVFDYSPDRRFSLLTDVGFYHIYPKKDRMRLAENVYRKYLSDGGMLLLWCLSDEEPDWGGAFRISNDELCSNFSGWDVIQIKQTYWSDRDKYKAYFMQAINRTK